MAQAMTMTKVNIPPSLSKSCPDWPVEISCVIRAWQEFPIEMFWPMAAIFVDRFFSAAAAAEDGNLKPVFNGLWMKKCETFFSCRGKLRPLRKELIGLNRWGEIFSNKWTFASTFLTPTLSRRNLISWKGRSWSLQLFKEIFFSLNSA